MGREVRAVVADPEMDLIAAIDPKAAGDAVEGVTVADLSALLDAGAEVAVDFTAPGAVMPTLRWTVGNGIMPWWAPPASPRPTWANPLAHRGRPVTCSWHPTSRSAPC
jgi:hypothetical protein